MICSVSTVKWLANAFQYYVVCTLSHLKQRGLKLRKSGSVRDVI